VQKEDALGPVGARFDHGLTASAGVASANALQRRAVIALFFRRIDEELNHLSE